MQRPDEFAAPRPFGLHLVAACAMASLLAPLGACAHSIGFPQPSREVDVEIVDRSNGERLPIYEYRGERWVAGVPGHRYAVSVRNLTQGRLLAVMSVDGVNVLSGETAGWDQRGYVFGALEHYEVAGWRKSQERIAAFEFSSLPDSYASRTGRPENVGVIGVAVFREAMHPSAQSADSIAPTAESSSAGAMARRIAPAPALGTAHGRGEESYVSLTNFERARSTPDEIVTIRYDRRETLVAMGVIAPSRATPDPFPSTIPGFVPDPPSR
jgi:hypothetical protein